MAVPMKHYTTPEADIELFRYDVLLCDSFVGEEPEDLVDGGTEEW